MTPRNVADISKMFFSKSLNRLDAPQLAACRRMVREEIERMETYQPHADQAEGYYARRGWLLKILQLIGE